VNIMQPQQGADEHVTRHYVWRRRGGDGAAAAASVQRGCVNADLNAAQQITVGTVRNGFPILPPLMRP
jgi:hypothetical protein